MMERLTRRAQAFAAAEQARQVERVAARMQSMLGSKAQIEGARVVVSVGLLRRWLVDPSLRFLSSGFK
jgi:hypothetical protein